MLQPIKVTVRKLAQEQKEGRQKVREYYIGVPFSGWENALKKEIDIISKENQNISEISFSITNDKEIVLRRKYEENVIGKKGVDK